MTCPFEMVPLQVTFVHLFALFWAILFFLSCQPEHLLLKTTKARIGRRQSVATSIDALALVIPQQAQVFSPYMFPIKQHHIKAN